MKENVGTVLVFYKFKALGMGGLLEGVYRVKIIGWNAKALHKIDLVTLLLRMFRFKKMIDKR